MSEATTVASNPAMGKAPAKGVFECYLTLWVALCIVSFSSSEVRGDCAGARDQLTI